MVDRGQSPFWGCFRRKRQVCYCQYVQFERGMRRNYSLRVTEWRVCDDCGCDGIVYLSLVQRMLSRNDLPRSSCCARPVFSVNAAPLRGVCPWLLRLTLHLPVGGVFIISGQCTEVDRRDLSRHAIAPRQIAPATATVVFLCHGNQSNRSISEYSIFRSGDPRAEKI